MTEIPTPTNLEQASQTALARLEEFPGDPVASAEAAAKELRMQEMENWANGMGAHTERLADKHHLVSKQIIEDAANNGLSDVGATQARLESVPKDWRTGVEVGPNSDVSVHDHYPYSGDTPAGGWHAYRSPVNIRK